MVTNSNISMAAWVYPPDSPAGYGGVCGFRNNDIDSSFYVIQLAGTNNFEMRFRNSVGTGHDIVMALTPNVWQHIALVYDGSTLKSYLNGVLNTSIAASGVVTDGTRPFHIGKNFENFQNHYFNGRIDDVRLYSRDLSAQDIYMLFLNGSEIRNAVLKGFTSKN